MMPVTSKHTYINVCFHVTCWHCDLVNQLPIIPIRLLYSNHLKILLFLKQPALERTITAINSYGMVVIGNSGAKISCI